MSPRPVVGPPFDMTPAEMATGHAYELWLFLLLIEIVWMIPPSARFLSLVRGRYEQHRKPNDHRNRHEDEQQHEQQSYHR